MQAETMPHLVLFGPSAVRSHDPTTTRYAEITAVENASPFFIVRGVIQKYVRT